MRVKYRKRKNLDTSDHLVYCPLCNQNGKISEIMEINKNLCMCVNPECGFKTKTASGSSESGAATMIDTNTAAVLLNWLRCPVFMHSHAKILAILIVYFETLLPANINTKLIHATRELRYIQTCCESMVRNNLITDDEVDSDAELKLRCLSYGFVCKMFNLVEMPKQVKIDIRKNKSLNVQLLRLLNIFYKNVDKDGDCNAVWLSSVQCPGCDATQYSGPHTGFHLDLPLSPSAADVSLSWDSISYSSSCCHCPSVARTTLTLLSIPHGRLVLHITDPVADLDPFVFHNKLTWTQEEDSGESSSAPESLLALSAMVECGSSETDEQYEFRELLPTWAVYSRLVYGHSCPSSPASVRPDFAVHLRGCNDEWYRLGHTEPLVVKATPEPALKSIQRLRLVLLCAASQKIGHQDSQIELDSCDLGQ